MEDFPNNHEYSPEKVEEARQRFLEIHRSLPPEKQGELMEKRMQFGIELGKKYENAREYALYHVLIGSTIANPNSIKEWDFPGEDSVELFMDRLTDEYFS